MKEELAILCHSQWSEWVDYMFSKGTRHADGTLTLPKWAVERWTRQMETTYADLSENEKINDRIEADKFIEVIKKH